MATELFIATYATRSTALERTDRKYPATTTTYGLERGPKELAELGDQVTTSFIRHSGNRTPDTGHNVGIMTSTKTAMGWTIRRLSLENQRRKFVRRVSEAHKAH